MCQNQHQFLLCSCVGDEVEEHQIDWILRRRNQKKGSDMLSYMTTIGQRVVPDGWWEFSESKRSTRDSERYLEIKRRIAEFEKEAEKKSQKIHDIKESEKFQDMVLFMLSELNSRNCFDTETELIDKDVLSLKLDKELGVWVDFLYRKSSWRVAKFSVDANRYSEIIKGKINSTR